MKIYTSYFYQLRFFKPNMIPLSTALGDPLWFHNNTKNKDIIFLDRNGVINGLRILPLVPDSTCSNLCKGREGCKKLGSTQCDFLSNYHAQLSKINFAEFMKNLESHISTVCKLFKIDDEPIVVILVHEAMTNPCSERVIIQKWFAENGMCVTELNPVSSWEEL